MNRFFTSDWHLDDNRLGIEDGKPNVFYRPFKSVEDQNETIISNLINFDFKDGDELIHLGDVTVELGGASYEAFNRIRYTFPKSKFTLILGNYDTDKINYLSSFFNEVVESKTITIKDKEYYLNHYPEKCIDKEFGLTGHIHSYWKVQKNMIKMFFLIKL